MHKEILFIYPQTGSSIKTAPFGYLHMGAVLKQAGFQVTILDERVDDNFPAQLKSYLVETAPLFVGISAMTGGQIASGLSISRYIKTHYPEVPIVWGGIHPTLLPRETIFNENIDIVVKNEGEQTALELAMALRDCKSLNQIKGLVYKKDGHIEETEDRPFIELVHYPGPDWSLVDVEKYILSDQRNQRRLDIYTSRGCPFACGFCYNTIFNKRRWRSQDSKSVLNQIIWLTSNYQLDHIWFSDDNFMANPRRVLEICDGLQKSSLPLTFSASARPEYIYKNHELMRRIKETGFQTIYMGAESGSDRVLKLINRSRTKSLCLQAARICKEYSIIPIFSFIVGFPGETKQEVIETLDFAKQLQSINKEAIITDFKIYTPYPGTPLYDLAIKEGLKIPQTLDGWSEYVWGNIELPWVKDMRFLKAVSLVSLFANYHQEMQQNADSKSFLTHLISHALKNLAQLRWQSACFVLPFEWSIINNLILSNSLKKKRYPINSFDSL